MTHPPRGPATPRTLGRLRQWLPIVLLIVASALACDAVSLMLVHLPGLQSQHSANAGNAFGAAAASGSVVVLYYMARTMRMQEKETADQRTELRLQREAIEAQCRAVTSSNGELHRTSEALIRGLHVSLLRMAMTDPDLAATWPSYDPAAPPAHNKQQLYLNAVLSLHLLAFEAGDYPETQIEATLRSLFELPLWQSYWESNRADRAEETPPDTAESRFSVVVERAYQAALGATAISQRSRRRAGGSN